MKNDTSFSSSLFLHTDSFDTNKNNNIETNLEQNNNLSKDTKINNISINDSIKNNGNSSPNLQYPFFNSNKNQESKDQSELNNFDIAFFLPKDLKENIEADEEEFQNENEHNFNDDEFNSKQINNFNADSFNQFNYFNNEYSNLTTDKFNFKNFNNFQISGNECFNNVNDNKNQENINYGINLNSFDSFYKNINLNQNISSKNFSNNNMNDFFVKQENEQKINMPYNINIGNSGIPKTNQNVIWGNKFPNNQFLLNNNSSYLSPVNQMNFNPQLNDFSYFEIQNKFNSTIDQTQNEYKKRKKKIIDDYTIEMFGRRGWICELCNNFNYETRKKCNRCHINKKPKKINSYLLSEKNKNINHKNDWHYTFCGNFNYSFRVVCNRCSKKKME
jgi:hypothetical protein